MHANPKNNSRKLILFSLLLGGVSFLLPAFVFCIFLTCLCFFFILKNTDNKDRDFVFKMLLIAIVLRIIALVFTQFYCLKVGKLDIFGDGEDNLLRGYRMAMYLKNELAVTPFNIEIGRWNYNTHLLTFLNTIFFRVFGYDMFFFKYINILCVILTGWLIYDLTVKICGSSAAKTAMGIFLFWPTYFLYPLTALKESQFILALMLILWSITKMFLPRQRFMARLIFGGSFAFSALCIALLRSSLMAPLLTPYIAILIFYYVVKAAVINNNYRLRVFMRAFLATGIILAFFFREKIAFVLFRAYQQMIALHVGFINELGGGGWNNTLLSGSGSDYYTFSFFVRYLLGGWLHFFFEPFPWHFYSSSLLAYFPLTLVWAALMFLSVFGVIWMFKNKKFTAFFPLFTFAALYATAVGMSVANIGTQIRFRDAVLPVVVISASCGIVKIRQMNNPNRLEGEQ